MTLAKINSDGCLTLLNDVKSYMDFWGWSMGGAPGSIKRDDEGMIVAHYGDEQWIADVQRAIDTIGRLHDKITEMSNDDRGQAQ